MIQFKELIREEVRKAIAEQVGTWDEATINAFAKQIKKPASFKFINVTFKSQTKLTGTMSFAWTPTLVFATKFKVDPNEPNKLMLTVYSTSFSKKDGSDYSGEDFAKDLEGLNVNGYRFSVQPGDKKTCTVTLL